ncbi:PIN domain-containing protein [Sulfolobus sp. E5-1-F]|uniref:type II toxin-antitoxin system VapC family toxin n=1 Tax=Sulfolobaceae TaxID=118883 RepID=UPI001295DCCE|nr:MULTISPECIES: type II toxin-antitoxin system VapC family toxin [unclassified Sulfolobus]QGA54135.1 PIN domain-containing protein [Sulfolobus sp. E5-1-F]QGA69192.1 PIN domain-containing protein [Sulfolobus sp. E11-6]
MAIIDTSALFAIYFPEKMTDFIRREIEKVEECYFLDLIFYEFPNVIRKRIVRNELSKEKGDEILIRALSFVDLCIVVNGKELTRTAYDISLKYSLTTYDASLIALAKKVGDVILTADEKLLRGVRNFPEISKYFVFP